MDTLKESRERSGLSQRNLAQLAGTSYKTIQLVESGRHDPRLSTLENIADALGYPTSVISTWLQELWELPADSVAMISRHIVMAGEESWKIWLFNFVDTFRIHSDSSLVEAPPVMETPRKIKALLASTVESLCAESDMPSPPWCRAVGGLSEPWFVSGMESLVATALVESPVHFRKRNIFVLRNFLERL
jgi:transcriptional regulator with XRE-family HTH domain